MFAALIVPAAFAGQPTIQRIPLDVHFVADSCGFPVQVDATGTIVDISYTDALGNFHDFQTPYIIALQLVTLFPMPNRRLSLRAPERGLE